MFNLALIYRKPKKQKGLKDQRLVATCCRTTCLQDFNTIVTTYAVICPCPKLLQTISYVSECALRNLLTPRGITMRRMTMLKLRRHIITRGTTTVKLMVTMTQCIDKYVNL